MEKPDYVPDVSECRDLVGNPIKVGDKVAWGAGGRRSVGLGLGVITGISFDYWKPSGFWFGKSLGSVTAWSPVYTLTLKSTIAGRVGKSRRSDHVVHYVEEGAVTCQLKYLTHLEREVGVEGAG